YGMLDGTAPRALGMPMLAGGLLLAAAGFVLTGRRVRRSRYRPDPWGLAETLVASSGVAVGLLLYVLLSVDPTNLHPSLFPLSWPQAELSVVLAILAGALPAVLAPPTPLTAEEIRAATPRPAPELVEA